MGNCYINYDDLTGYNTIYIILQISFSLNNVYWTSIHTSTPTSLSIALTHFKTEAYYFTVLMYWVCLIIAQSWAYRLLPNFNYCSEKWYSFRTFTVSKFIHHPEANLFTEHLRSGTLNIFSHLIFTTTLGEIAVFTDTTGEKTSAEVLKGVK